MTDLARLDARIKFLLLGGLSTAALFSQTPAALAALLALALFILLAGGVQPAAAWSKARGICGLIAMLFIIQCLFERGGEPLFTLAGLMLISAAGFQAAVLVSLRLLIIVLSALIALSGKPRDYLLALTQCRMPYEIAFMVLAALRFLPILREEARDVLCAAQMRGLRFKKTGLKKQAEAYISIMLPVAAGAIRRAEQLSLAMEARAFRAFPRRTTMRRLRLRAADWAYAALFCLALAAIMVILN
ncbi:MAG: energy-coupling factor transporter transmembrane protein EcfT [Clostridiales bacterium]|nr:energy-coupling factor transporter transmembrane protein EcfT [Clostridiales bacterium]